MGYTLALPASVVAAEAPVPPVPQTREPYDGPPLLFGSGKKKMKLGGYGGFGAAYTRLLDQHSGLMSMEAAFLFDHRLSLGLAGYGFTRTPRGPRSTDGAAQEFASGYGGFVARYSIFGDAPVYGSLGLLLGGGAINLHQDYGLDESEWDDGWEHDDEKWDHGRFDPFMVVQPEATLHVNVTRWFRLGAVLGYRFTGGVRRFGLSEDDLNGIVAGGNLQLGWF